MARQAIKDLWPKKEARRNFTEVVATSIFYAHSHSAACWSLTLFSDGIALNVGQVRVLDVGPEVMTLYLQGPRAPKKSLGVSVVDPPESQFYPAVPVPAFRVRLELRHVSQLPSDIRVAHNCFIASAAARKRVSPFKSSHSPAASAVFGEESGHRIPEPSWHVANGVGAVDEVPELVDDEAAGFGDSESNRAIEIAAVQYVSEAYRRNGWTVVSVERMKCGYDLRCTKGAAERHVEVKGCAGEAMRFILTAKEHAAAFSDPRFRAAVVSRALDESRALTEFTAKQLQSNFEYRPIQYWARRLSD